MKETTIYLLDITRVLHGQTETRAISGYVNKDVCEKRCENLNLMLKQIRECQKLVEETSKYVMMDTQDILEYTVRELYLYTEE